MGTPKKFLGSQSVTIFYGPLINYAVIRPLTMTDDCIYAQRIGSVGLAVSNNVRSHSSCNVVINFAVP